MQQSQEVWTKTILAHKNTKSSGAIPAPNNFSKVRPIRVIDFTSQESEQPVHFKENRQLTKMNCTKGPEITITVCTTQVPDDERWQTRDSPCFPHPLCVALPPKRPDRQRSAPKSPITGECRKLESTFTSTAPRRPRRRLTVEPLTMPTMPPARPIRQKSEAPEWGTSHMLSISRSESSMASAIEEEWSDDEEDLSLCFRLSTGARLEDAGSRDASPTPPTRQRSAGWDALRAEFHATVPAFDNDNPTQPKWMKLWETQAEGNDSLSNLWNPDE